LLAPESASFRIVYDVTATTPGARFYWNSVRRGSDVSDIAVTDVMSGAPLQWKLVEGAVAREHGLAGASADGRYIEVALAQPVPAAGETRLRIVKTYRDAASYTREGERILFARPLGIKRNSVALPAGYELVAVNYPSQVRTEDGGRIVVSFMNPGPAEVPYRVVARPLPQAAGTPPVAPARTAPSHAQGAASSAPAMQGAPVETRDVSTGARVNYHFGERARQDREIVYFLEPPETHSFRLYHDYTETREGVRSYLNVVRAGSKASNPSAKILDTGESLKVETLTGAEMIRRGIRPEGDDPIALDSEVVIIWFEPVKKGQSVRLRIEETYTDATRYLLVPGRTDELVWDRVFGRPRNTVVLPAGWYVTASSIPAVVSAAPNGRIQLYFQNDRPDEIAVFLRARKR
jgi:hypothetical protein